ncbi:4'-phosphopantetheinyl transferase [Mariniflexile fucanivorans]|uniref:4'-phosphopantetheinyl transferase n=1 Tax=Mariniflexile fucanivorans TaxID=264023 RepID=A0A4R1RBN7_9FLAO|nr:4'-phosphopantetheinyl transferase superfamily protein [Mariniflexile fucanivorans]TCL63178.1 4'-phosphopantetheinyl transferase [Mariniflexile fucanivorans]
MIQNTKREVFFRTLEILIKDFNCRDEYDDLGVKFYKIELSNFQKLAPSLMPFLSHSESNRANRFHFVKDKNTFVICRTVLKFLLAEQTGLDIHNIFIESDSNKKPFLPSHPSVHFNISHATDYAIIAIAKSPVGVDIEYVNKEFNFEDILPTVFNKSEIDEVNTSGGHVTFYKLWTRKEAIVKAIGVGIDDNISEIISLDGCQNIPSEFLGPIKQLQVFSFKLNEDYFGAVAISETSKCPDKLLFYQIPNTFLFSKEA